MEDVVTSAQSFWQGRSVLLTGHTGFKGAWLALWLRQLGAQVHGYALDPPTSPSLFEVAGVRELMSTDTRADIRDLGALRDAFARSSPEVVLHLAAQPLVRESYRDPLGTLSTNVIGTANLLEAARLVDSVGAVVVVTTDKVYHNREWVYPYREDDQLGGRDPYSASKAAAELVTASYRASFFGDGEAHPARVATARAGNVIGGADWAVDRLVPDCLRAFAQGRGVMLRNPDAVRPWQHVLEPLSGYLRLAERLLAPGGERLQRAWNFGPDARSDATVGDVAALTARLWGAEARVELAPASAELHEAGLLRLDSSRTTSELGWIPRWSLQEAVARTVDWHRAWRAEGDMRAVTCGQLDAYEAAVAP